MGASARVEIRVRPDFKTRLERAAALAQIPVSEFVRSAVEDRAEQVIAESETSTLVPGEFFDELLAALDAPAVPNPALSSAALRSRELLTG